MINFTSRTKYFISSKPTDMRNGREGLAGIVREVMGHNPKCYDEAFIFYSKDYRKVKILHYDLNGYVMYQKWFDNGKLCSMKMEVAVIRFRKRRLSKAPISKVSSQTELLYMRP